MDRLTINGKNHTPEIDLDPEAGFLSIQGESFPENPFKFYRPVLEWLERYFTLADHQGETVLQVRLTYLNTSSTKVFMMILDTCGQALARGRKVSVHWQYRKDDELVKEMGEDLGFDFKPGCFFLEQVL